MSAVTTPAPSQREKKREKIQFAHPTIKGAGNITARTRQGGSSSQYDSYSDNRP